MTITFTGGIKATGELRASINTTPSWVTTVGTIGNFDEGTEVSFQFEASDPEGGVTYVRISGDAFPTGLSLSSGGLLSGTAPDIPAEISETPTESATFVIRATDAGGLTTDRSFSITINNVPPQGPQLWTWGENNQGRLGLGDNVDRSSPTQVGYLITWTQAATGSYHSLARKSDGTLWNWGAIIGFVNKTSPLQVGAETDWSDIAAGRKGSMGVKTDGTMWGWGYNRFGALGNGQSTDSSDGGSSPIQVGALTNWSTVSMGDRAGNAIKTDGTLWSWGLGSQGQLGNGTDEQTNYSPIQVGSLTNWSEVSSGNDMSAAIKTDGTLWTWGFGQTGRLGLKNTTAYSSPVQVGSLTNWFTLSLDYTTVLAIKTDGTLWSWGQNSNGQIGDGTTITRSSPVQIGADIDWSVISTGQRQSLAIKTDGTLWAWGNGVSGRLGLGNTTNYSSPVQVGSLTNWDKLAKAGHLSQHALAIKKPVV